ncbi:MAG: methyl-accepting chemotaxis protein [Anaerolineae bacterium]|nr:methyl-accepting chemotaxis protein [Anaerolineae bacterium]
MDYVYFSVLVLIGATLLLLSLYLIYRRGIALRLGVILTGSLIFVGGIAFVLGKEGISLLSGSLALVIGVPPVALLWITAFRQIAAPIRSIARVADQIAQGDLSQKPQIAGKDELGAMVVSFQNMIDRLNEALSQANEVVVQVALSAERIREVSQSLASSAEEQVSAAEEVASSLEETDSQVRANAESAGHASQLVTQAAQIANVGREKMLAMTQAMGAIAASSQQISKIIKVVDEIAFQTNLLALNAAVEAARAGQHGRGFAVVAQEVRNLAERSSRAAKETAELVEDAARRVMEGVTIANETAAALGEIIHSVTKVKDLMAEIAAASEEQAQGVGQISSAMAQVNQGAQLVSHQSEELAATADELGQLVEVLRAQTARFTLRAKEGAAGLGEVPPHLVRHIAELVRAQMKEAPQVSSAVKSPSLVGVVGDRVSALSLDRDERGYGEF